MGPREVQRTAGGGAGGAQRVNMQAVYIRMTVSSGDGISKGPYATLTGCIGTFAYAFMTLA